jgi:hypothetical protein
MANVFPEIEPDVCRRSFRGFEKMIEAADGSPQFNVPHSYLQTLFHLEWGSTLSIANRKLIVSHWKTARASIFTFYDWTLANGLDEISIGTGNGSQTTFTIPAKSTSGRTIKKAGVAQTEGVAYTYNAGTGAEGEDQVTFAVAPTSGQAITAAASSARRRHYGYWATRQIDEEHVEADIWRLVLDFVEKVPAT